MVVVVVVFVVDILVSKAVYFEPRSRTACTAILLQSRSRRATTTIVRRSSGETSMFVRSSFSACQKLSTNLAGSGHSCICPPREGNSLPNDKLCKRYKQEPGSEGLSYMWLSLRCPWCSSDARCVHPRPCWLAIAAAKRHGHPVGVDHLAADVCRFTGELRANTASSKRSSRSQPLMDRGGE